MRRDTCYHAEVDESVHVVPPRGKHELGVVWRPKRATYGTSVASNNLQSLVIKVLVEYGQFVRLKLTIVVFWRGQPQTMIVVRGEDFLGGGNRAALVLAMHC